MRNYDKTHTEPEHTDAELMALSKPNRNPALVEEASRDDEMAERMMNTAEVWNDTHEFMDVLEQCATICDNDEKVEMASAIRRAKRALLPAIEFIETVVTDGTFMSAEEHAGAVTTLNTAKYALYDALKTNQQRYP